MRRWVGLLAGMLALLLVTVGTALATDVQFQWGAGQEATLGCDGQNCSDYIIFATGQTGFGAYMAPYDLRWMDASQQLSVHGKIGEAGAAGGDRFDPSGLTDGPVTPQEGHTYIVRTMQNEYYRVSVERLSAGAVTFTYARGTSGGTEPQQGSDTPAPAVSDAPSGLTAVSKDGRAVLAWQAPAAPKAGIDGYYLYRGETAGGESPTPLTDFPLADLAFTDSGVAVGKTYYYIVQTVYRDGSLGGASAEAQVQVSAARQQKVIRLVLNSPSATVDGQVQQLDVPPQLVKDRTMVPLRFIGTALGAELNFEAATKTVTYRLGDNTIVLQIGSPAATVNGVARTLDVAPMIVQDRTLVPLRFISENLGAAVSFNATERLITITADGPDSSTPASPGAQTPQNPGTPAPQTPGTPTSDNLGTPILVSPGAPTPVVPDTPAPVPPSTPAQGNPTAPPPLDPGTPAQDSPGSPTAQNPATQPDSGSWISPTQYTKLSAGGSQTLIDLTFLPEEFSGTSAPATLHVIVGEPADVTKVEVWQEGAYGTFTWHTDLTLLSQQDGDWVFNDSLTDVSLPYHVRISSTSLGSQELQWTYHTADQGN